MPNFSEFRRSLAVSVALALGASALVGTGTAVAAPVPAASMPTATGANLLAGLATSTPSTAIYDRSYFPHWMDEDGDGCDTRREVLIAESVIAPSIGAACAVSGRWESLYDGVVTVDPSTFDVDHVVALAEAWKSGAWAWTTAQRRAFANDLDDRRALRAVSASSNRSKGADDPANWLPTSGVCEYALDWVAVKYRWSLSVDTTERAALETVFAEADCGVGLVSEPVVVTGLGSGPASDVPAGDGSAAEFTAGVHRRAGSDRYTTALSISASFASGVPVVYVATGAQFPDALSAAPAAAAQGGPLLLVPPSGPTPAIITEINRLAPDTIVVVGGDSVVSAASYAVLSTLAPSIRRDAGSNRYATSQIIVERAFSGATDVFVATGRDFPDALSASAAAGALEAPVLLVDGTQSQVPTATTTLIATLGAQRVRIVGGPSVVSSGIESVLRGSFGTGSVLRHAGSNRYATGAAVNSAVFSSASTVFFAAGTSFPDALSGAALAGALGSPLYVVQQGCVPTVVLQSVNALSPTSIVLLGGTSVLSAQVGNLVDCASIAPPPPPPPPPPPAPSKPANPGDTKNCNNFSTQAQAQGWFDFYYPYYGDVARLDFDNDGVACESLP